MALLGNSLGSLSFSKSTRGVLLRDINRGESLTKGIRFTEYIFAIMFS